MKCSEGLNFKEPFFFKINSRSPKDSRYYKDQQLLSSIKQRATDSQDANSQPPLCRCQARTFFDVVCALVGSDRIAGDINAYLKWRVSKKPPMLLVLQKWNPAPAKNELRCWVYKGLLTSINPSAYPNLYPTLLDRQLQVRMITAVKKLQLLAHSVLPWESYILDVCYDETLDVATILEYNPWGPYCATGSQLYSWELDMVDRVFFVA